MGYCKFCGMILFDTDKNVDICPVCKTKMEMNQTFSAQHKRIDDAMRAPFECPKLPKLSDGAITNSKDSFLPYMHGSEKRDCEIVAPPEVIKKAFEKTIESNIGTDFISDIQVNIQKDASVFSTAYMMTVDSCMNEILCTLPVLWNCQDRMSHITKTDNSGYHAVSLDGIVVAEFTITPLYSESSIAFERSIKYSAYADKVRRMATLGDYLDILKPENAEEDR